MLFLTSMPAQPSWYLLLPNIVAQLQSPVAPPFLDRPSLEQLFRVGRRQAIRLMGAADGYQVGKTFLVDRNSLIRFLMQVEKSGVAVQSRARKRRVATALNEAFHHAAARKVQVQTDPEALYRGASELPDTIELIEPGKLQINYTGAENLLAQIVELVASATNDYPGFLQRYGESR